MRGIEDRRSAGFLLYAEGSEKRRAQRQTRHQMRRRATAMQQRLDERGQRRGEQCDAQQVERPGHRLAGFRDQTRHAPRDQCASRQVDEENPAPADPRGDQPAHRRTECHRDAGHDADQSKRIRARPRLGIDAGDQRKAAGHDEGRPDALQHARDQQRRSVPCQPARQRSERKDAVADQHRPPPAVTIRHRAGKQQAGREGQTVGIHHPGISGDVQPEFTRDRRQRDDDRRHVEVGEEGRHAQQQGGHHGLCGPTGAASEILVG